LHALRDINGLRVETGDDVVAKLFDLPRDFDASLER